MTTKIEQLPAEETRLPRLWHSRDVDTVLSDLETRREGLSTEEAKQRLEKYGLNQLPQEEKDSLLKRFLRQFNDVLIYVLLVAAVMTAFLEHWIDTGVILAVVLINAIIGFLQEGKAELRWSRSEKCSRCTPPSCATACVGRLTPRNLSRVMLCFCNRGIVCQPTCV